MPKRWTPSAPEEVRKAVQVAIADLEVVEHEIGPEQSQGTHARLLRAEYWGIRAATRKRLAEVEFLYGGNWRLSLREALRDYQKGLEQGVNVDHWILGQYVVLAYVLDEAAEAAPGLDESLRFDYWSDARRSVMMAIRAEDAQGRMWGHSTMADLLMVSQGTPVPPAGGPPPGGEPQSDPPATPERVLLALKLMVSSVGGADQCDALWPTFRQFWRWHKWWTNPRWEEAANRGYEYLWSLVKPRLRIADE